MNVSPLSRRPAPHHPLHPVQGPYTAAPALYHYLLARQERFRWVDRLVWPYGPVLLALGAFLEITVF